MVLIASEKSLTETPLPNKLIIFSLTNIPYIGEKAPKAKEIPFDQVAFGPTLYLPFESIVSTSTTDCANFLTASTPESNGLLAPVSLESNPIPELKTPSVPIAVVKMANIIPVLAVHFKSGPFLKLPFDNILSTSTIASAIFLIADNPESIGFLTNPSVSF